jgi:hypothetical protein
MVCFVADAQLAEGENAFGMVARITKMVLSLDLDLNHGPTEAVFLMPLAHAGGKTP